MRKTEEPFDHEKEKHVGYKKELSLIRGRKVRSLFSTTTSLQNRMPPPSYGSKISTRSTGDHEPEIDGNTKTDLSSSGDSSSDDESKGNKGKYDKTGLVKSLLGPSFEDAVLRTFEFGKSLIQKAEDNEQAFNRKLSKKAIKPTKSSYPSVVCPSEDGSNDPSQKSSSKKFADGRQTRKRIVFTAKLNKELPSFRSPSSYSQKLFQVSKIRSLDSDLKHLAPSPEKIKRELEALVQINKDEPPEYAGSRFYLLKNQPKINNEVTVMPSLLLRKNEGDIEACSSAEAQSVKKSSDYGQSSTSKLPLNYERSTKKKVQAGICQAPEFLTSALGPSLDVSIIDNLKMMRNLFKCDSGRGEGSNPAEIENPPTATATPTPTLRKPEEVASTKSEVEELETKAHDLRLRIEELQQKEQCLIRRVEEEEREREFKRKAFEEEERKLCNMKACLEGLVEEERKNECSKKTSDFDVKYENLRQKIACEEEKLCRLKEQYDCYKREIMEAKTRKEGLKRNKSLLDAWDVIASKACHTRLPSFSRANDLNRKQLKSGDNVGNIHCCFMPPPSPVGTEGDCGRTSRSSNHTISNCCSKDQTKFSSPRGACKKEENAFPIQRDITCGLHKPLKTCCCSTGVRQETISCNSDDDLLKKCRPFSVRAKSPCRSQSETFLKRSPCAKIVKVLWAITRINIFQDNCKTYEVMDATTTPPPCAPLKTEGIFVVKNPERKSISSSYCQQKRRCGHQY